MSLTPAERALLEESTRRYMTDAEFHARAYVAVNLIRKADRLHDDDDAWAYRAASLALVLAERPVAEIVGSVAASGPARTDEPTEAQR